jgi:hypothetical protein
MSFRDILNLKGPILLERMYEPEENSLFIIVNFTSTLEEESVYMMDHQIRASPVVPDTSKQIHIFFPSYISYVTTNEAYCYMQGNEIYEGDTFRIHKHSRFRDFVKLETFADGMFPEKEYTHYQIPCLNHIIDVISFEEPEITKCGID